VPLAQLAPEIREVLDAYRQAEADLPPARREAMQKLRERLDLDASVDDLAGISAVIRRAVDRSVKIVQNLRSFSRASGEDVPADLQEGIEETLMLLGPRLRASGVQLVRKFAELPLVVCRAGEINQVFMNLLVNALQALERPPPAPALPTITIETWVEGEMAAVGISDNGPGVPAPLSSRIFDPFFTTKPRGQGTGLGLSISTDIARRHGGSLSLEPVETGGARFVCRLPMGLPMGRR
jgi:C4-dicarboxylate-specific signal transduction histidine kinase